MVAWTGVCLTLLVIAGVVCDLRIGPTGGPCAEALTADSSKSASASGYDPHHELFVFVCPVDSLHSAAAHDFIVFALIRVRSHERNNHVVRPPPLVRKPASCPIERQWPLLNAPLQGLQYFEGYPRRMARLQNFIIPESPPNDHVSVEQLRKKWSRCCARVGARRCDEYGHQGADCRKQKFHPTPQAQLRCKGGFIFRIGHAQYDNIYFLNGFIEILNRDALASKHPELCRTCSELGLAF